MNYILLDETIVGEDHDDRDDHDVWKRKQNESTSSSSTGSTRSFHDSLRQYIDCNKPDPIQQKQIQSWKLIWNNYHHHHHYDATTKTITITPADATAVQAAATTTATTIPSTAIQSLLLQLPPIQLSFTPTNCLSGTLTWMNEYISITLYSVCYWDGEPTTCTGTSNNNNNNKTKQSSSGNNSTRSTISSFYFNCRIVHTEFVTRTAKGMTTAATTGAIGLDEEQTRKEIRTNDTIHRKMMERLQKDDYIKKLVSPGIAEVLCEALIVSYDHQSTSASTSKPNTTTTPETQEKETEKSITKHLEERVQCSYEIGEAIRRSIFSTSDNTVDIFDLVLNYYPLLPSIHVVPIANRARLRILEDVMYEACEVESDEFIVDELYIDNNTNNKNNNNNSVNNNNTNNNKGTNATTNIENDNDDDDDYDDNHNSNDSNNKPKKGKNTVPATTTTTTTANTNTTATTTTKTWNKKQKKGR